MDFVIDASERLVRAELERWPDGVYHGESWMVSDGIDPSKRYRIAVEVTIDGSEITFDFSGHRRPGAGLHEHAARLGDGRGPDRVPDADERRRDRRADERGPVRAGARRSSARARCSNPRFPASSIFGNQMCDEVLESIMLALADALPDRVTRRLEPAPLHGARRHRPAHRRRRRSRSRSSCAAARARCRAPTASTRSASRGTPGSMRSPDMEMFELSTPHFMEQYEYLARLGRARASGAAGSARSRAGASTGSTSSA